MSSALQKQIAALPTGPGVYRFLDGRGRLLYVGKALNLRARVRSYLAADLAATRGPAIAAMLSLARRVTHQPTDSELTALILEANLIRRLQPKYNAVGKDDRSAHYIVIERGETYPRLRLLRERTLAAPPTGEQRPRRTVFGPFPSGAAEALRVIRRIFPFRDCSPTKFATYRRLGRGCLWHTLGRCPAPCIKAVSPAAYRRQLQPIVQLLSGRQTQVVSQLEQEMARAAAAEDYEAAARARDQLFALEHLRELTTARLRADFAPPESSGLLVEAYDVSHLAGEWTVGSLVRGRIVSGAGRRPVGIQWERDRYRRFRIRTKGINDPAGLAEVLARRLRRARREPEAWSLPDLMLVDGGRAQLAVARQAVKSWGAPVPVVAVAKGPTRKKADLYCRPADRRRIPLNDRELTAAALLLREEAHRLAISYYRKLHRRHLLTSRRRPSAVS